MRQVYALTHPEARKRATEAVARAPDGWIVRLSEPTRSLEQNALLWSRLHDVAEQVEWHGRFMDADDWKWIFTAALKQQDAVPGINGGFVVIGANTSGMTKREMADLIELVTAFGTERNVRWTLP